MRQETQHPLKLSPEEQKHLLVGFEKTMVCVAGNERALISKIAYNRFKLWNQELLDAARERKDDVELKKALEAWSLLELAVEKPIIYDSAANFLRIGAWANAKGAKSRAEAIAGLIQEHAKGNKRLGNCVVLAREFPESPQYAEVELLENAEYGRRLANRAGTETSPADRR